MPQLEHSFGESYVDEQLQSVYSTAQAGKAHENFSTMYDRKLFCSPFVVIGQEFGLAWHINHKRLFNAKSFLYKYIKYMISIIPIQYE